MKKSYQHSIKYPIVYTVWNIFAIHVRETLTKWTNWTINMEKFVKLIRRHSIQGSIPNAGAFAASF